MQHFFDYKHEGTFTRVIIRDVYKCLITLFINATSFLCLKCKLKCQYFMEIIEKLMFERFFMQYT